MKFCTKNNKTVHFFNQMEIYLIYMMNSYQEKSTLTNSHSIVSITNHEEKFKIERTFVSLSRHSLEEN